MTKKSISILGSTGSIGTQTLDIINQFPSTFSVFALTTNTRTTELKKQIHQFKPTYACIQDTKQLKELESWIKKNNLSTNLVYGNEGLEFISTQKVDLLVVAISGTAGIQPTYNALKKKIPIALACKEVMVSAGDIIMKLAKENKTPIIPIDSEHAAIQQCLASINNNNTIHNIIITASGGPFWEKPYKDFSSITPKMALKHPNWSMGQKISIDSATMVNKGLEIIEAHHLFSLDYNKISPIIHRQSIVHALMETIDGNVIAHLSPTDMRFPIQYALSYPKRFPTNLHRLELAKLSALTFEEPDYTRFPLLKTAIEVGKEKGSYPVVFNAANEASVQLFLEHKISFLDINKIINETLNNFNHLKKCTIEEIIKIDKNIKNDILQSA